MFTENSTKMCRDGECRGACLHEISNPNKFCIGRTKKDKCSWGGRYLKYRPPPFYIGIEKLTIQMSIKNSKKIIETGNVVPHGSKNFCCQLKSVEEEQKEEISTGVDGISLVSAFRRRSAQIPSTPGACIPTPATQITPAASTSPQKDGKDCGRGGGRSRWR